MNAQVAVVVALVAACGGKPATVEPGRGGAGAGGGELAPDPAGRDEAPLDERIAAIERGMNDLAPVARQCWAAAAADDFHVAGDVRLLVEVAAGKARAEVVKDSAGDPVLTRCLVAVASAYAWPPPLHGQRVELPFHFAAPAMQNVIDRRFVPRQGQLGVEVAVLIDELNSGNPAASLLQVTVAPHSTSGPRGVERTEVWLFQSAGAIEPVGGAKRRVVAGDALVVPVGTRLSLISGETPLQAVVAIVPGGREGAARAGALPGAMATASALGPAVQPQYVAARTARRYPRTGGATTILIEPPLGKGMVSASRLEMAAGVKVPLHVHPQETELLFVLGGAGTMTVAGAQLPVTMNSVVQIPAGVEHGFVASEATTALQLYTPAGPEQRFKTMK